MFHRPWHIRSPRPRSATYNDKAYASCFNSAPSTFSLTSFIRLNILKSNGNFSPNHVARCYQHTSVKASSLPSSPTGATYRMISLLVVRIRMHQRAQRPPIDDQPWDESTKLRRREEIHFKHGHRMRSDGSIPKPVDAELGDCAHVLEGSAPWVTGDIG